jgi:hypothetical protein
MFFKRIGSEVIQALTHEGKPENKALNEYSGISLGKRGMTHLSKVKSD